MTQAQSRFLPELINQMLARLVWLTIHNLHETLM